MPLAPKEEMIKWASQQLGKSVKEIEEIIEEQTKSMARAIKSERLMVYSILTQMGVKPPLPESIVDKTMTIEQLYATSVERGLNTEGIVVGQHRYGDELERLVFNLLDKTGSITSFLKPPYGSKAIQKWEDLEIEIGDFIQLEKVGVWGNNRNLSLQDDTIITKISDPPYTIDDLPITDIKEIELNQFVKLQGSITGTPFNKDGAIYVKFTDGYSDVRIRIPPIVQAQAPEDILSAPILTIIARQWNKNKALEVTMIKEFKITTKNLGEYTPKPRRKKETKKTEKLKKKEKTPKKPKLDLNQEIENIIIAFDGITKTELLDKCIGMFGAEKAETYAILGQMRREKKIVIYDDGSIRHSVVARKKK